MFKLLCTCMSVCPALIYHREIEHGHHLLSIVSSALLKSRNGPSYGCRCPTEGRILPEQCWWGIGGKGGGDGGSHSADSVRQSGAVHAALCTGSQLTRALSTSTVR